MSGAAGDGDELSGAGPRDLDAGLRTLAFDSGPPLVCDEPAVSYERASDEHGRLAISGATTNRLIIGDKLRLIPGHCDPTGQPLRLVCPRPRGPRRAALADYRQGRCVLTLRLSQLEPFSVD
jgi:hypothetical protein